MRADGSGQSRRTRGQCEHLPCAITSELEQASTHRPTEWTPPPRGLPEHERASRTSASTLALIPSNWTSDHPQDFIWPMASGCPDHYSPTSPLTRCKAPPRSSRLRLPLPPQDPHRLDHGPGGLRQWPQASHPQELRILALNGRRALLSDDWRDQRKGGKTYDHRQLRSMSKTTILIAAGSEL